MKRILSILIVAILMAVSVPAFAENIRTSGDFEYKVRGNGTAEITGYIGEQTDIIIPTMIDGYMVTSIGERAFACEVSYRSPLAYISVTLPDGVTSIGEKAFWSRNVNSINLPDSLEYIGYGAFAGNNACAFRISSNHPYFAVIDNSLYNKQKKELLHFDFGTNIPEGIVSIGDYAGYYIPFKPNERCEIDCPKLPTTLQSIGDYAFSGLRIGSGFSIPSTVDSVGIGAFENCDIFYSKTLGGSSILIPADSALREISDYSFKNTVVTIESIEGKTFMDNLTYIGVEAFCDARIYCSGTFVIPASCTTISEGAFEMVDLDGKIPPTLVISEGVKRIEDRAFKELSGRSADLVLPSTLEYIGAEAFIVRGYDRSLLESIYLPVSLEHIDITAFGTNGQGVTYTVEKGSYAERWADENALVYNINGEEASLDWLN